MAEISREYKYNRQVFDANARLWTEKYANSAAFGASGWGSLDAVAPAKSTQSEDMENLESLPNAYNKDYEGNRIKRQSLRQKLSLKSERSEKNQDAVASHSPSITVSTNPTACFPDGSGKQNAISENLSISDMGGVVSKKECEGNGKMLQLSGQSVTPVAPRQRSNGNNMKPNNPLTSASNAKDCAMQSSDAIAENGLARSIGGSSDSLNKPLEGNKRNIRTLGMKLSLKSVKLEKKNDDQKENMVPNHMPSHSNLNNLQKRPLEDVSSNNLSEATTVPKQQLPNSQFSHGMGNQGRKKLCLLRDRLSLKPKLPQKDRTCDKGSTPPAYPQGDDRKLSTEVPLSAPVPKSEAVARSELPLSAPVVNSKTMALGSAGSQEDVNPNGRPIMQSAASIDNVIVSDSEDSADECERPSRSRLSLMRRRLAGKLRN